MAKARSPDRVKAEKLYRGEGLALNEIADKIGVPVSTVRSWKKRDGWDKEPEKPKPESVAKKTKNATRKVQRKKRPHPAIKEVWERLHIITTLTEVRLAIRRLRSTALIAVSTGIPLMRMNLISLTRHLMTRPNFWKIR